MRIALKINYYVPFDHLMGKTELLHVKRGSKLTDILELLSRKYKGFASPGIFDYTVILVNGKCCGKDLPVGDGDQISILTPVVGG